MLIKHINMFNYINYVSKPFLNLIFYKFFIKKIDYDKTSYK